MLHYHSRRIVALISFISLGIQPLAFAYSSSYVAEIQSQYLSSYGQAPKVETPTPVVKNWKERFFDYIRGPKFEQKTVIRTPRELNDLLIKASPIKEQGSQEVIDTFSVKKLELLIGGEQPGKHLLKHLTTIYAANNQSVELLNTINGKKCFAELLSQPTNDQTILKSRQEIIKAFVADEELLSKTGACTLRMKDAETSFLDFFAETNPETEKLIQSLSLNSKK